MNKIAALLLVLVFLSASCTIIAKPAFSEEITENSWVSKAPMHEARFGLGVAVVNGKIYALGGHQGVNTDPIGANEEYDPAADSWTTKASMPTPRSDFGIAVYQNKIYCIGGLVHINKEYMGEFVPSGVNEAYDPATDTWETLSPMPSARLGVEACAFGGKIYLVDGGSNATEAYDPATDTWTMKTVIAIRPSMDREWRCASVVADNKIHVIGAFPLSNSHQIFNPSTDRWSLGTPVISGYWYAAAVATTGENAPKRIHVFGASSNFWNLDNYPSSTSQSYDLQTGRWTIDAPIPSRRINVAVAVVNDLIYAIGGFTPEFGNQIRDSAVNEQYIPVGYYGSVHNTPAQADDVPPAITISSPENKTYNTTEIPLSFNVNESGSWMSYKLDGNTPAELDGNTTITGLISGSHSLTVYATDAAGNTGTSETVYFTVALPESFPTTLAITASGASLAIVGIGLLFYYRKRKRGVVQE